MTSYAKDPSTGKPLFRDSDAPDIKQDPQEAADFAARVGSRATGTTAERNAWEFRRAGMRWWDTTLKQEFQDDGDGFKPAARVATFSYQVNGLPDTSQFYTDGSLAVLPGGTSDSFVSAVNKSSITVPAGLYDMFFTVTNSAATTGRTSSQVAAGAAVYGRSSAAIPEDTWTMATKRYLTVETVLTFGVFKTSGGVSNLTGQLVIEKVW